MPRWSLSLFKRKINMLIASIILNVILAIIAYAYRDLYKTFGSSEARKNFTEFDEQNGVCKMIQKQAEEYVLTHDIPAELVREQQLRSVDVLKRELCKCLLEAKSGVTRVGDDGLYVSKEADGKFVFSMTDEQILEKFYSDSESILQCKISAAIKILHQKLGLKYERSEDTEAKPY